MTEKDFLELGYSENESKEIIELLQTVDPDTVEREELFTVYKILNEPINKYFERHLWRMLDKQQRFIERETTQAKPAIYFENGNQITVIEPEAFDMDALLRGRGRNNLIWEMKIGDDADEN